MTVSIKPLEWREEPIPPSGETLASSVVGLYCIPHSGDRFYLRFRDAMTLGDYSTLDKAKAAAQSDYESRIRSALSAQVQDVAGPAAWRYRHDPTVQWSYSECKHPRNDLEQEPLFLGHPLTEEETCRGHHSAQKPSSSIQNCGSSIAKDEPATQCVSSLTLSNAPTETVHRTSHTSDSKQRHQSKAYAVVPLRMTADMINAWTGGMTVTTDEIAYHTSFQAAWSRVLAAAPAKQEGTP